MVGTWQELFLNVLERSGRLGEGQVPNAAAFNVAQRYVISALDELDGEGLALPVMDITVVFNTIPTVARYVLGTGDDAAPANPIRPETILRCRLLLSPGVNPVYQKLVPMAFVDYRDQQTPNTQSTPFQYAVNPAWPQSELYLFPAPSQVWEIQLTTKLRWVDIVGNPSINPAAIAQLNSGFTNALINIAALRLAEKDRLDTPVLRNKMEEAKYFMMTQTWNQHEDLDSATASAFPWDIVVAGRNPA